MLDKNETLKLIQSLLTNYNKDILNKIYTLKTDSLEKDNYKEYTPLTDYNPATKKYVDDSHEIAIGTSSNVSSNTKILIDTDETSVSMFDTSIYQLRNDLNLNTESKNIIAAINYLDEQFNTKTNINNNKIVVQNDINANEGTFHTANFAGQGKASSPIGNTIHHYTDGTVIQIDNVGESNSILVLKNAHNSVRRPDKSENFSGSGNFLALFKQNGDTLENYPLMYIDKNSKLWWSGRDNNGGTTQPTYFQTNKDYGSSQAFIFEALKKHTYFMRFNSGGVAIVDFLHNGNRFDIKSTVNDGIAIDGNKISLVAQNGLLVSEYGEWKSPQYIKAVGTSARPTTNLKVGMMIFDTQLNKPIWCKQSVEPVKWVDALGNEV